MHPFTTFLHIQVILILPVYVGTSGFLFSSSYAKEFLETLCLKVGSNDSVCNHKLSKDITFHN
jgi:hypothetical protein